MRFFSFIACISAGLTVSAQTQPHTLTIAPGKTITLRLPEALDISVAATGIKRARFFAQAPDGRIFVTSLYNLADNTRGAIYLLDGWDAKAHRFTHVTPYLEHLRNPNNLAFYTDAAQQTWMYVPLTDKLVRYRYVAGAAAPAGPPQVLMRFPDYGLSYKYGGWHLTRTVAVATLHGRTRVYVAAGSSCNYCREREVQRAAVIGLDPDGKNAQVVAHGLRNAVDLRYIEGLDGGSLFASNMGDDHLGDQLPEDTFFELDSNAKPGPIAHEAPAPNYGWPVCYFANGKPVLDKTPLPEPADAADAKTAPRPAAGADSVYGKQSGVASAGTNLAAKAVTQAGLPPLGSAPEPLTSCHDVPAAYTTFTAHSSPLGLAWFGADSTVLRNSFVVALHGSGHERLGVGYKLVRFTPDDRRPVDLLTGFWTRTGGGIAVVHGRPCGLLRLGPDSFLLTDDWLGVVYYIGPRG